MCLLNQAANCPKWFDDVQLHPSSPDEMVTGDVDGSGKDDIIATVTSITPGIFISRNQGLFLELIDLSPDSNLTVGNLDGQ